MFRQLFRPPSTARFALIKPGPIVADIRGSIGATVFARNRGGAYVRNRTTPLNPQSLSQSVVRAQFGSLSNDWSNTLTQSQRDGWDAWADAVPYSNVFGEDRFLAGINAFVAGNSLLAQAGEDLALDAPTILTKGPSIVPTIGGVGATDVLTLASIGTYDPPAAGITVLVYASPPQNAGVSFFKGPFRLVGSVNLSTGVPELPAAIGASPYPFAAGQAVFARTRVVTPDGRVGNSSVTRFLGV